MAINLLKGYAFIIRLAQEGRWNLADIKKKWKCASFNEDGKPLTTRTFHNYRNAILDTFNIEIQYNSKCNVYEIADSDGCSTFEEKQYKGLLLNTFTIASLCYGDPNLSKRVLLGTNPFGCKYVPTIISSIENNNTVLIALQTHHKPLVVSDVFEFEPYAIKNYDSFWILWGKNLSANKIQTINVIDIDSLTETDNKFDYQDEHNDGWMNGWLYNKECTPDKILSVKIKVFKKGQIYSLENFPIDPSQKIIESGVTDNKVWDEEDQRIEYAIFEYQIPEDSIMFFFNQIFKRLDYVQIISPDYLSSGFFHYIRTVTDMFKHVETAYGDESNCKEVIFKK